MRVVTVARKPCASSSTTANVAEHQAGALNIDACRIEYSDNEPDSGANFYRHRNQAMPQNRNNYFRGPDRVMLSTPHTEGRWPANVLIVGTATRESLDAQSGVLTSGSGTVKRASAASREGNQGAAYGAESRADGTPMIWYGDSGGASRFFRCFEDQSE